ncbi:MAG: oligoribonuclease [Patescibacteria group bacterium]
MINKRGDNPTKLLWLDMEFTGLNSDDLITEVAVIVTDFDMNGLDIYESGIRHDEGLLRQKLESNPWYRDEMPPEHTEAIVQASLAGKDMTDVEGELIGLIAKHWDGSEGVILAGNSIHADRAFIRRYMKRFEAELHYRMLDVSSLKVYMQGAHGLKYQKKNTHRAIDDIRESIEELQYYIQKFKKG